MSQDSKNIVAEGRGAGDPPAPAPTPAPTALQRADVFVGRFCKAFCYASMGAIVFNMGIIVFDVLRRFAIGSGLIGVNEYVSVVETILIFMGLAYTEHGRGLVHITFFMRRFPGAGPYAVWTANCYIATAVAALLTYASFMQFGMQLRQLHGATTSLLIPYYPFYFIMAIGFIGYTAAQAYGAAKATAGLILPAVKAQVIESWPA